MGVSRIWRLTVTTAALSVAFGAVYFTVRQFLKDDVWRLDLAIVNKSLATAALFLIALSMALTAGAYFSRGPARLLAFRKHFGLVGFWTALAHGAVNHILVPAAGLHPERTIDAILSDGPGLGALVLFAAMALLSNAEIKGRVGGETWRKLLRYGGYAGLVLAVAHTALLKWSSWARYFGSFDPILPSLSLPVALFAIAAILLRLAVWISERRKA